MQARIIEVNKIFPPTAAFPEKPIILAIININKEHITRIKET